MKVLHVIPSLSFVHGGPSQAIRLIEHALREEGVRIDTATTDDDGQGRHLTKPLGAWVEEEGARRRYFRKSTEFYKCSWSFARWANRHVRDYDLLHIHALFSFTSSVAAWAATRSGVPYVVRPLGTLNRFGLRNRKPGLKVLSLRFVERQILEGAAAVHFTSVAEQQEAGSLGYSVRGVVIPLAATARDLVGAPALSALIPSVGSKRVVLFLSRLDPMKNVGGVLAGFKEVAKGRSDLHLVIAGTGDPAYVAGLKKKADEMGVGGMVSWPGHVEGSVKAALLRDAAVFVLPSFSESFGIAAAEALAAGLPCVLGKGVALAAQVQSAGAGVSVEPDAESIAAGLCEVLSSPERRTEMANEARKLAEGELSTAAMGRRMRAMYEEIVKAQMP